MPRLGALLLGVGTVLGLAALAHGQGAPFKESRLSGLAILVRHQGVQRQLKITKEQNDKFREVSDAVRKKHDAEFEKMEQIENGRQRSEFKRNLSQKIIAEVTKEIPNIFSPEQVKRLEQISMQQAGIQAFDEKSVREKLKLTPEQLEKIAKVREATGKGYLDIRQSSNDGFEESKSKEYDLKKAIVDRALDVLTAEQRTQWRDVVGEPFSFIDANDLKAPADQKSTPKPAEPAPFIVSNDNLHWVDEAVAKHQPAADERKIDKIGWANGILHGLELGKKHRRPVIMHTYNDGRIGCGRS